MAKDMKIYDYENLTEQIKVNNSSAAEENFEYNLTVVIASITWLLLTCISVFIYCCNYWELFKPSTRLEVREESEESEQLQLEQQCMLLQTQVSEVSGN